MYPFAELLRYTRNPGDAISLMKLGGLVKQAAHSSRRSFLNKGAGAAAALGLSEVLSPIARSASSPNRVVVCIYLIGGNDSNNMIVPLDSPAYNSYAAARGPLALAKDALLPVASGSSRYGFHPSLSGLQDLYNRNVLAVLANVGRTAAPGAVPKDLFQHTGMQVRYLRDGYIGIPWATPTSSDPANYRELMLGHGVTLASAEANTARRSVLSDSNTGASTDAPLPAGEFGQRLATVLNALKTGGSRQAFLVPLDGFDTHTRQLQRQAEVFQELNDGLVGFWAAIRQMGMAESVTVYTDTEFNRALTPNKTLGTEHGWGGHQLILGGATLGGQVYGSFPSMQAGGADDAIGNGTWIPSTSSTQYAATLAAWYGKRDLSDVAEYANSADALRPRLDFLAH